MSRLLIVDDELSMREFLEIFLRKAGHEVLTAADGDEAVRRIEAEPFDLVITDLRMPGTGGLGVLERCRQLQPDTPVIVMTAYASTQTAIEAMKLGAYDYFTKPFKIDEIAVTIDKALEKQRLVRENRRLRSALEERSHFEQIVGRSPLMHQVFDLVRRIAPTRTNVLILGESGTGKELVARAIHAQSDRARGPFLVINCGAIPENLLESELFGHKRGAFTGATADKEGLFKAASGGSLFLDEVGELPLGMQVKLLRVLQERKVKAIGDTRELDVDVRIVSATNRDLEAEVRAGRFREDLYYRLNVISIELPPLRDRLEDVPLLAQHFLAKYSREFGKTVDEIEPEAMQRLLRHGFSGNVRELENVIERAVALAEGERVTLACLPRNLREEPAPVRTADARFELPGEGVSLDTLVETLERQLIEQALERTGGRKKDAARLLGVSFRSLRYRLQKLSLDPGPDEEG